ncbi:hypothetical protein XENOCAPTIV_030513, partial [Xenoophorus captivus]
TRTGEKIIGQLSSPDGPLLEEKLETLVQRWRAVNHHVSDRQRRRLLCKWMLRMNGLVTHELLDKVGEVETNLQSHTLFQDRMTKLTDWVIITNQTVMRGLNPVQAQVLFPEHVKRATMHEYSCSSFTLFFYLQALEASMKDRKKDLEDLLAHSIELQKHQQLLPQEKVPDSTVKCFDKGHIVFNYTILH